MRLSRTSARHARAITAVGLGALMITGSATGVAFASPPRPGKAPKIHPLVSVPGHNGPAQRSKWVAPRSIVPVMTGKPSAASYRLPSGSGWRALGASGLSVSGTGNLTVDVLSQAQLTARGLTGPTIRISRSGTAAGTVGISAAEPMLSGLFGADYAAHVRWIQLPDCATAAACGPGQALPTHRLPLAVGGATPSNVRQNSSAPKAGQGASTATLALSSGRAVLLSAGTSASASDGSGNYSATSLAPDSRWNVSPQTGDFTWNYPLRVPPAAAGPSPDLTLAYDSGSIDGQTGTTNNQTSEIGNGWSMSGAGYIERSYVNCADNGGPANAGDECWKTDNASLSFGGHSGDLIKDASTGSWHVADDANLRVEHLVGNSTLCNNGTYDNDCWRLTTPDGTQYYFGRNRLPGWTSSTQDTNSTWTVPICGTLTVACTGALGSMTPFNTQAWRYNLDYVVDPHGNSSAYYYKDETNLYGENGSTTASASYVRGGQLSRIDYGMRAGYELTGTAPEQVLFTSGERCLTGQSGEPANACDENTPTNSYWPDVPWYEKCASANCGSNTAPTFWSLRRITGVNTQYWNGSAYVPVDSWTLGQSWPDPLDGTSPAMQLDQIGHTGQVGSAVVLPPTTFSYGLKPNRVNAASGVVPLEKERLQQVNLDSGGSISVSYLDSNCGSGNLPSPQSNTMRCYPQYWSPPGSPLALDWFRKYLVSQVTEDAVVGRSWTDPGNNADTTTYDYSIGTPAWRYDMTPLQVDKQRTWSVFAGYNKVRVEHGDPLVPASLATTDYTYLRGMDDDLADTSGTRRSVSLTSADSATTVTDSAWWAGQTFETQVYNGMANMTTDTPGAVVTDTISTPWASAVTATATGETEHIGTSATTFSYLATARHTDTSDTRVRTALSAGGWRTTDTASTFDGYGRTVGVDDRGDTSTTGDDRCTTTSYADNTASWLLSYPAEVRTVGVNCASTPAFPHDAISDERTSYDSQAFGSAPTRGDATRTESVKDYDTSGNPIWLTTDTTSYDALGRELSATDALPRTNSTVYTPTAPAAGSPVSGNIGPVTQTVTTNPMGWQTTSTFDPAWGSQTSQADSNGHTTTTTYDGLGRRSAVWLPDRQPTASFAVPSYSYSYAYAAGAPVSIATTGLTPSGGTATSYQLYDGLLRLRQTQAPAEGTTATTEFNAPGVNGRDITDVLYDDAGRTSVTNDSYYNSSAPSGALWIPKYGEADIPGSTQTIYDGDSRPIAVLTDVLGVEQWRTSTSYGGDHIDVTPPSGGTPTTTYTDARGNVTSLLQYHGASASGVADTTTYRYDNAARRIGMTDSTGSNSWSWSYDVTGRVKTAADPDRGTTSYTYDDVDRVIAAQDGRGNTVAYAYDALDRPTNNYQGSTSGPLLASWTYDTLANGSVDNGQLASSTSYVGSVAGTPGTAYTESITGYDAMDRPTGTSVTLPSVTGQAALAGTYSTGYSYNPDGSLAQQTDPAMGGLPAETLKTNYTALGHLWSYLGQSSYLYQSFYDQTGLLLQSRQYNSSQRLDNTYTYSQGTQRLTSATTTTAASTNNKVAGITYTYDNAGLLTSATNSPAVAASDTQCFGYDYLQRLSRAWTPSNGNCSQAPTAAGLGGPAPYWQDYGYDLTGNRTSIANHSTSGTTSTDTYTYPTPGSAHPHAVSSISHSGGGSDSYSYNGTGDTTAGPGLSFSWDANDRLSGITKTAGGQTQNRVYDTSGTLLVQSDPINGTTAYLGDAELHLSPGGTVTGQRIYTAGGRTLGSRAATAGVSGSSVTWQATDPMNTATISEITTTGAVTSRAFDPFGNARGSVPAWPTDRGFLNAPVDPFSSFDHLGARDYSSGLGRFLSADPVAEPLNPQQNNGYSYAWNDPVSKSDPSGLAPACDSGPCDKYGNSRPVAHKSPNSCIALNGGDYTACNVGNTGSGGGGYNQTIVGAQNTPAACVARNGGDYTACNVGNTGSASAPYAPVPPPPPTSQPVPPKQPSHHCGFTCKLSHARHAVTHAVVSAAKTANQVAMTVNNAVTNFVVEHRGLLATIAASALCLIPLTAGGCMAYQAAAYAIRVQQRGWRHFSENAGDLVVTYATLGLGSAGDGAIETFNAEAKTAGIAGLSRLQTVTVRVAVEVPDALAAAGGCLAGNGCG